MGFGIPRLADSDNAMEIARHERATNAFLYGLYGLGAEEIKMVEKAIARFSGSYALAPRSAADPWPRASASALCVHDPLGRKNHDDFGALAKFGFQRECAAVEFDEAFDDRQAKTGAFFGVFLRERAAAERGHDDRDFLFRNSGPGIAHSHILTAAGRPADPDLDRAAWRRELDRVRQQVQDYLTNGALVGPDPRQIGLDRLFDRDVPFFRAERQQMPAILDDMIERDRFFLEFEASGLDPATDRGFR